VSEQHNEPLMESQSCLTHTYTYSHTCIQRSLLGQRKNGPL